MAELSKTEIKQIKIEENKLDELESELSNAFEIVQNSFRVQKDVMLTKNSMSGDFDEWKKAQKINREKLKKDLQVSQVNSSKIINNAINNTINNLAQVVNNIGDVAINLKKQTKIEAKANKGIRLLSNQTLKDFDKSVAKVYKLRNQEPLFDAIFKQTQEGIDKGIGITYKDGKHFSFKSYMEMNVRTTVRQEANKYLFEASKENGVVFYICSYFGDCAKDHEDYQGKYYYDEDWTSFGYDEEISKRIQDYIDSNNIESYQSVVDNEPFLTTRPNCRHSLRPVVLDDVFTHTDKQMTNEYDIRKGTYKDSNYIDLQNQRKMERNIRNYKTRLEEHKLMYKENPNPKLKTQIAKDRALIKKWEDEIDYLVNSNSLLKRDKRKENNKVLVQDLGAGYQLGLKIDGKNMYFKSKVEKPISPKDIMPMQKTKVEIIEEKPNYISKKELEIFNSIRDKKRENLIVYDDTGKILHKEGGKSKGHTGYEEFNYKGLNAVHNHPEGYGYYPSKTDLANLHLSQAKSITIVSKEHTIKIIRTNKVYQDSYILQDADNIQNEMRNLEKRGLPSPFGNMSADQYRRKNNITIKETNDLKAEHQLKLIKKLMENEGYIVIIK